MKTIAIKHEAYESLNKNNLDTILRRDKRDLIIKTYLDDRNNIFTHYCYFLMDNGRYGNHFVYRIL
jgi:hypothetical protein